MQWVKLGDFIEQCDERNSDNKFSESDVRGISTLKLFITTKANLDGVPLSSYKVVREDEFAFVPDTSRRGDKMSLAFNDLGRPCIVSSISSVFRVSKPEVLLPEYLYLWFCRPDFDRYARYHSWGSAREAFSYDEMCRIEIPLPAIDEQKQVVAAWRGLKNLGEQNEQMAGPLMDLCQSYIEHLYKTYELKDIGDYFTKRDERNYENKFKNIKGLTVYKKFIETKADMNGVSLSNYKIVYPGDIAYVSTTNRNGDRLACGLCEETCIVSTIYDVLKIDTSKMLPEYLFLWFARSEMDRYARYNSWGSAREVINYEDLCRYKIPVPPIEIQRAIVEIYNCARTSKYISETAKKLNSDICPALMRQIIGDNQ